MIKKVAEVFLKKIIEILLKWLEAGKLNDVLENILNLDLDGDGKIGE
jgi:hypothetical protein